MAEYDLVVRGGTVVTAAEVFQADVGIREGRVAALGERLVPTIAGRRVVIQAVDANHPLRDRDHSDCRGTGGT
jgi:dihydropyrimidinase